MCKVTKPKNMILVFELQSVDCNELASTHYLYMVCCLRNCVVGPHKLGIFHI